MEGASNITKVNKFTKEKKVKYEILVSMLLMKCTVHVQYEQGGQGFGHRGFGQGFGHARNALHETRFWAPETAQNYKS